MLADANVVALQPEGRDVLVSLEPDSLDQLKQFITEIERRWDTRLDALRKLVEDRWAAASCISLVARVTGSIEFVLVLTPSAVVAEGRQHSWRVL